MTITGHLIRTDGSHAPIELDDESLLDSLNTAVGCRTIDMVSLNHNIDVVVDDESLLVDAPALNLTLSIVTHALGGRTAIFGNGILVGVNADGSTVSLSDEQKTIIDRVFEHGVDNDVAAAIATTLRPAPHAISLVRAAGF